MAISIKCPECGTKMNTRTSQQITDTLKAAEVYCGCCFIRARATIALDEIKYPNWSARKTPKEAKEETEEKEKPTDLNPHYFS